MLDIKYVLENFDDVARRLHGREPSIDISSLRDLDAERRRLIQETQDLQTRRNAASAEIGARKKSGQDATDLLSEQKLMAEQVKSLEAEQNRAQEELTKALEVLPNIPIDPTPLVPGKEGNKVVRSWGDAKKNADWPFPFRNHLDVGENLGVRSGLDFPSASKMTGHGWPMYRGDLARLEWALVLYLIDKALAGGRGAILPAVSCKLAQHVFVGPVPEIPRSSLRMQGRRPCSYPHKRSSAA